MKKIRIIRSISGVITNSSTEIFTISGPDSLKAVIGTGLYRKYRKNFIYLSTEEDVEKFLINEGFDHHYSSYMAFSDDESLGSWRTTEEFMRCFSDKQNDIWNIVKDYYCKKLKGTIIYYDYRCNSKILRTLQEKFPSSSTGNDSKSKKNNLVYNYYWNLD